MSFFSKAVKAVGNFVGDVSKASIALPLESYGSVTGKKTNITYSTKLGATVGKGATGGLVAVHATAKAFLNGVTGGLATKGFNKLRSKENQETAGSYAGSIVNKGNTGFGEVDKLNNFSLEGGRLIGSLYGSKVASESKIGKTTSTVGGIANSLTSGSGPSPGITADGQGNSQGNLIAIIGGVILLLIAGIMFILKK